ncbi:MAG: hypothetical protein NTW78_07980 [Campylobacterales bacterium]|nr:hypothetical protein [Campylobacterales bacterium]
MFRVSIFLISVFIFSGCVSQIPVEPEQKSDANQKSFEQEDTMILFALRAEQLKDYESASELFYNLYEKSDKKEYLYRSLQSDLVLSNNERVIQRIDVVLKDSLDDFILVRMKAVALIQMQKYEDTKNILSKLVEKSNLVDDYIMLSDVYVKLDKFDMAIKYLESAYVQDYNEKVLDKMSIILYVNLQRKKDAIAQLETHARVHGCSELICTRLLAFYSNDNNVDGILSAYLRLYKINSNEDVAKKIVQIYSYKREYLQMMNFLEESGSDDATLLQLYSNTKNYKKAFSLSDKLYATTGEIEYLGQSAIFEYESSKNKSDKELLKRVTKKFENVVKDSKNPLYLNYFGFILIDHDIDASKGIQFVQEALKIESDSIYYLDSLAWGYYKLGRCEEASSIMNRVIKKEGENDPEVLLHGQEIEKCLNINREAKK